MKMKELWESKKFEELCSRITVESESNLSPLELQILKTQKALEDKIKRKELKKNKDEEDEKLRMENNTRGLKSKGWIIKDQQGNTVEKFTDYDKYKEFIDNDKKDSDYVVYEYEE